MQQWKVAGMLVDIAASAVSQKVGYFPFEYMLQRRYS